MGTMIQFAVPTNSVPPNIHIYLIVPVRHPGVSNAKLQILHSSVRSQNSRKVMESGNSQRIKELLPNFICKMTAS